jgi:hypothetical protein
MDCVVAKQQSRRKAVFLEEKRAQSTPCKREAIESRQPNDSGLDIPLDALAGWQEADDRVDA